MINTPCPGLGRLFVVEVSNIDPNNGHEHGNLADFEIHATRTRYFLQRGYWVEIYDDDTRELLAGPFDPDQSAPAYIV